MRKRKKGNLEERIAQSTDYLIATEGIFCNVYDFIAIKDYIDYESLFGNNNPIYLDVGCGMGGFTVSMAKRYPNINFIGIEKISNIIVSAIELARAEKVSNVRFLNCRVECIQKYIPTQSISRIYLNFSNPLPNSTDERHRLTCARFLSIYKDVLNQSGHIEQKTDDEPFFEYSLESFKNNNFELSEVCYDLANNPIDGDVLTEHEVKFMRDGKNIHRVVATPIKI